MSFPFNSREITTYLLLIVSKVSLFFCLVVLLSLFVSLALSSGFYKTMDPQDVLVICYVHTGVLLKPKRFFVRIPSKERQGTLIFKYCVMQFGNR